MSISHTHKKKMNFDAMMTYIIDPDSLIVYRIGFLHLLKVKEYDSKGGLTAIHHMDIYHPNLIDFETSIPFKATRSKVAELVMKMYFGSCSLHDYYIEYVQIN